jgi:hypothetical protein
VIQTYKLKILRREDYSGEHREWTEEIELPAALVDKIRADALKSHRRQTPFQAFLTKIGIAR